MLSRPSDESLRRFAWTKELGTVQRLFECSKQQLTHLAIEWKKARPYPATTEELGSFSENDWRRWVRSVGPTEQEAIDALARFARTCAIRLGEVEPMVEDLLQRLVDSPQERLGVELKPWLIPSEPEGIAKIAKACLALRNNNGGHLVLGFDDNAMPSAGAPPNVAELYHVDRIQEIVSKYASEPFAVTVEFRETQGQAHPIVVVPDGVVTPVFAKSTLVDPNGDNKRLIEDDVLYVRSVTTNNRVSSTKIRRSDINRLMKVCFDNREADIGAFIRRHLAGITPDIVKTVVSAMQPPAQSAVTPMAVLDNGYQRFLQTAAERRQKLPDAGYWEAAAVVNGLETRNAPSRELLNRLQATRHDHSGWPPWTVIDNPNAPDMNPRVVRGVWEALMVSGRSDPFAITDYWQINPAGQFYYVRLLEDDARQESHGIAPRSTLDFYLVVYRVTETISTVLQFTGELGASGENSIAFAFRWRGLHARLLGCWSNPRRMLRQQRRAYDDIVTATIEMAADAPESAVPSHVYRVVRQLFLAFEGYELSQQVIEDIARDVLKDRT